MINKIFLQSKYIFPLVILLGIVVTVIINKSKPAMKHQDLQEKPTLATFIAAKQYQVRPAVKGFGEVVPDILLNTVAEVSGKITELNPLLRKGNILAAGTKVLMIDQKDYLLALKQAEAELAINKANLKELQLTIQDTEINLSLAEEKLLLANNELARIKKLLKKSSTSRSSYDNQRSNVLQLKQEVQNLKSQLETLPAQVEVQKAQIDISSANIETQQHNLERTSLTFPFSARVIEVNVEAGQFVGQGSQLFSIQNIDKILVDAQFPLEQFQVLAKGFTPDEEFFKQALMNGDSEGLFASLGLKAKIFLNGEKGPVWPAKFERITGSLDPSSRTLGVIVSVKNPYQDIKPGTKPPLIKGMYTEVLLESQPKKFLVIPRDALHNNQLYVINQANQLERITPDYQVQGAMLLIEKGLTEGARIITSDLFPAVPNMKLEPKLDEERTNEIKQWVAEQ